MESLRGMQSAAAPNFFYTRLRARMEPAAARQRIFILRPAFITTVLAVLLVMNVVSLFSVNRAPKGPAATYQVNVPAAAEPASLESFAKAYDMNNGSVYE